MNGWHPADHLLKYETHSGVVEWYAYEGKVVCSPRGGWRWAFFVLLKRSFSVLSLPPLILLS